MANGAANYTEEMVMAMVTTQLTIMSFPFFNVQIVPFSSNFERLFGADTRIPGSAKSRRSTWIKMGSGSISPFA